LGGGIILRLKADSFKRSYKEDPYSHITSRLFRYSHSNSKLFKVASATGAHFMIPL
jgi:hypothetical protein